MQQKVDKEKSAKARTDGNNSFKKGRWVEAIGHYTTAIVADPGDAIPYSNRAAAYLKLDKFEDAERDCTTALGFSIDHIKSLYRRAIALKGLERYTEALDDLEKVLILEKNNEIASVEVDEINELLRIQEEKKARQKREKNILPPSPPRNTASIEEINEADDAPAEILDSAKQPDHGQARGRGSLCPPIPTASIADIKEVAERNGNASTSLEKQKADGGDGSGLSVRSTSTFADKRKSRNDKKTYISTSTPDPRVSTALPQPANSAISAERPELKPIETISSSSTTTTPSVTRSPNAASTSSRPNSKVRAPVPPADPSSTSPAAGLHLLTQLTRLDPESTWTLLSYYPPHVIPLIVAPLLEPEHLGRILVALRHGVETDKESVKTIMIGLRKTSRWKINAAMLDPDEKTVGKEIWEIVGEGVW